MYVHKRIWSISNGCILSWLSSQRFGSVAGSIFKGMFTHCWPCTHCLLSALRVVNNYCYLYFTFSISLFSNRDGFNSAISFAQWVFCGTLILSITLLGTAPAVILLVMYQFNCVTLACVFLDTFFWSETLGGQQPRYG